MTNQKEGAHVEKLSSVARRELAAQPVSVQVVARLASISEEEAGLKMPIRTGCSSSTGSCKWPLLLRRRQCPGLRERVSGRNIGAVQGYARPFSAKKV
jgi:hypothetical protein